MIEYSDNYINTSECLWQFKGDESSINNAGNPDNVSINNSLWFKYKSSTLEKPAAAAANNGVLKKLKIAVPLKYLSNFWSICRI